MLRQGRFELRAGQAQISTTTPVSAEQLIAPIKASHLHLWPAPSGASRGRGKAVLGLTLLGLSFVPGVNAGIAQSFAGVGQSIGGSAAAASFQQFGSQLLGRAGSLLLLSGLSEAISPQVASPAGAVPSASLPAPQIAGQGAAVPMIYGHVRVTQPVVISSGLDVDVVS